MLYFWKRLFYEISSHASQQLHHRLLVLVLLLAQTTVILFFQSPRKLKRTVIDLEETLESTKKKLKLSQQTARRLSKKVESLQAIISTLKHKQIDFTSQQYPQELRAFALTLNFYTAKAYNFVRDTFDLYLPHSKTLSKWYQSVDGCAGFSKQALQAVKARAESTGGRLICSLVLDKMAIRRQVEWDGHSYSGYFDMGSSLPVAKVALVFLIVSVTERLKIPLAYFLINGLNMVMSVQIC